MISKTQGAKFIYSGVDFGNVEYRYSTKALAEKNIANLLHQFGDDFKLVEIDTHHSDQIKLINEIPDDPKINCDGIITNRRKLAIALYAADCLPLIIASDKIPLLGLIHIGTAGANLGIHKKAVKLATKNYEINVKDLKFYLGPHIKKKSYMHSELYQERFTDKLWSKYISKSNSHYFIDLTGFVTEGLVEVGIPRSNITISSVDTGSNAKYFSHRRSSTTGETEGRNGFMCALI